MPRENAGAADASGRRACRVTLTRRRTGRGIGHDKGAQRYSPLTQINTGNVSKLIPAWTFSMKREGVPFRPSQSIPLVVNGIMYLGWPFNHVAAMDSETGKILWEFTARSGFSGKEGSMRSLEYWPGDAQSPAEILFATEEGELDRAEREDRQADSRIRPRRHRRSEDSRGDERVSQPSHGHLLRAVRGGRPGDHRQPHRRRDRLEGSGRRRARLGCAHRQTRLDISLGSAPRRNGPREPGRAISGRINPASTCGRSSRRTPSAAFSTCRFGSANNDYYGVDRQGPNLFANSLVAVDVLTGKLKWWFQVIHHDLWDYDLPVPPMLFDVVRDGKKIPAVGAMSKMGMLFILDRETGKPIYGVEERAGSEGRFARRVLLADAAVSR